MNVHERFRVGLPPRERSCYALWPDRVFTGHRWLEGTVVVIAGGKVEALMPVEAFAADREGYRLFGDLVPGLIDLQVNGAAGMNLNPLMTQETILRIHHANLVQGCTSYLPTLISAPPESIAQALEAVAYAQRQRPAGVLGLHLEGPFLNPMRAGIHDPSCIRDPTEAELARWLEWGEVLALITVAPEKFIPERWAQLVRGKARVSLGHSDSTYAQAMRAFDEGAVASTHTFNAMSPLQSREPGLVGATLRHPRAFVCCIPDGYHVDWATLQIAYRLASDRLCWVTDALAPAGDPTMKNFEFAGKSITVSEGRCVDSAGRLAGSCLTPLEALRKAVAGVGLEAALRSWTALPAAALGRERQVGVIRPGAFANFLGLSSSLTWLGTSFCGRWMGPNQPWCFNP